jgi:predicted nuclease of predicted toxin-antitoxin system
VILWLDAHLSPDLGPWIQRHFGIRVRHVRDLGLRDAEDLRIFQRAHGAAAALLTKDEDFVELVRRKGAPPGVVWLRCGNTSNARLKEILTGTLAPALDLIGNGEAIVHREPAPGPAPQS